MFTYIFSNNIQLKYKGDLDETKDADVCLFFAFCQPCDKR
jgi:hypothetical protein